MYVYLSQKQAMKINSESKMCSLLSSFIPLTTLLRLHSSLEENVCVLYCVFLSKIVCAFCGQVACSRINTKGQQFVRVQIVEGAQVWQAQEEFGEEGGVIWATPGDQ